MKPDLEKLRKIRTAENLKLKTNPYLKETYIDEYGDTKDVKIRDYQVTGIMNMLMSPHTILGDATGLGKAQPKDCKVLTPGGWVEIGSLKVDDLVIGSDGKPTKVLGVFPQGVKQAYRITMSDGSSTECCEDHLWTVRTSNLSREGYGWRTHSLKYLVEKGLRKRAKTKERRWFIPTAGPIHFTERNLPTNPYELGSILGNNSRTQISDKDTTRVHWREKRIPEDYLLSSFRQRMGLLHGMMDSGGTVSSSGTLIQFYAQNERLASDFTHLIRSLGGVCRTTRKRNKNNSKLRQHVRIVTISLPDHIIPFRNSAKIGTWKPRIKYKPSRGIEKVEPARVVECVCIRVAAEDSLYITDDFIVTHNTLQVLNVVGAVYVVEPDYIPIIITKKSALFQWQKETEKFMNGIEAITMTGEPYQREETYDKFFNWRDPNDRSILLMTYDTMLKDATQSVVRDRGTKPEKGMKKKLKDAKTRRNDLKAKFAKEKENFGVYMESQEEPIRNHMRSLLKPRDENSPVPDPPIGWTEQDQKIYTFISKLRSDLKDAEKLVENIDIAISPPITTHGIINYMADVKNRSPQTKFLIVFDEIHVLKNYRGKMHQIAATMSYLCERRIGMTATPVKNRLMEFFSILRVIVPTLFPKVTKFQDRFCLVKMQKIGKGRQVPVVVGHSKSQLEDFVESIEPYFLARKKHDVAKDLPKLVTREIRCELSNEQEELYDLAELGLLSNIEKDDENEEGNGAELLSSLVLMQQACNAPQLICDEDEVPFTGSSSKIDALLELLQNDLDGVKTIIFSRFEKFISLIEQELVKNKIKCVRITGKESKAATREKNKVEFQNVKSGTNVILITLAGSESINLQSAEYTIYMDSPWSWGDYVQLTGRNIRIGSEHESVIAIHLVAVRQNGKDTIDNHVIKILRGKKKLADTVAGEALENGLQFTEADTARDLFSLISQNHSVPDSRKLPAKKIKSVTSKKAPSDNSSQFTSSTEFDFSDI